MSEALDWNAKTIAEFRANEGKVGGVFEGAPIVLLHHHGRKSGREYVSPVMYLPHESEPGIIYVFARPVTGKRRRGRPPAGHQERAGGTFGA
ncbi:nitroreductase/quinone reductase family protein [Streptomyces sp. NPDC048417]|uniref:nitroreductase/quinone reductase family protein n=1 Tax=Streptomyces sp. NPDC048417 TaxID=3155387 RepID=UPI003432B7DF